MKIEWRTIERIVFVLTIIIGVIFHFRDKAKSEATTEVKITVHDEDIEWIKRQIEVQNGYWLEQKEVNGAVIRALQLDAE